MRNAKIGLALGSGAARGLAHIGVLEVLEKEGIHIDLIAGTSAGAVVGALYAQGKSASQMKKLVQELSWKKLAPLIDLSLPKSGLIRGRKIKGLLEQFIGGDIQFSHLKLPFACVATDIDTGEEIIIDHGSVTEALRASISLPAIFTVVKREGRYLVDGSLVNPVPVSVARDMGADFVIAVNVIPDVTNRTHRLDKGYTGATREPNIFHIITQSIHIGAYSLVMSSLETADIVIEPQVAQIGAGDFHHAKEFILQGMLAARDAVPEIKKVSAG